MKRLYPSSYRRRPVSRTDRMDTGLRRYDGSLRMVLFACLAVSVALFSPVQAAGLEAFDFTGNVDETRFKSLISELRCLVCQNQSLADSDADLAHDLRREVYELMDQGKSDQEIIDFLVARYGDFVLYNPPLKPETWILWYGPFGLLAAGLVVLLYTVRQRRQQPEARFSEQEQQRLKQLLGDDNHEDKSA